VSVGKFQLLPQNFLTREAADLALLYAIFHI